MDTMALGGTSYLVICRDDRPIAQGAGGFPAVIEGSKGPHVLATRTVFPTPEDAGSYLEGISASREPFVLAVDLSQLRADAKSRFEQKPPAPWYAPFHLIPFHYTTNVPPSFPPLLMKLIFVVNGEEVPLDVPLSLPLQTAIHHVLAVSKNSARPSEDWELRDERGKLISGAETHPAGEYGFLQDGSHLYYPAGEYGFQDDSHLYLTVKIGAGGTT